MFKKMGRKGPYRQEDFSGGMVQRIAESRLAENEVLWLENFELTQFNSAIKRYGVDKMNAAALAGAVQGICEYRPANGTVHLIVVAGGTVYKYNTGTEVFDSKGTGLSASASTRVFFVPLDDILVIINGVDVVKKYTAATEAVANLGGTPPVASFGAWYFNHLFLNEVSNPVRVYYSETDNPETGFGGTNYFFDATVSDMSAVTGFLTRDQEMLIGKSESITALRGMNPRDFNIPQNRAGYTTDQGVVNSRSFIDVNGTPYFLSKNGIYSLRGQFAAIEESWAINGLIQDLSRSKMNLSFAARLAKKDQAIFWVPRVSTVTNPDAGLIAHPGKGRGGLCSWSLWTGAEYTSAAVGRSADSGDVLYLGTAAGFVYKQGVTYADDGVAVMGVLETENDDFGQPGARKTAREIVAELEAASDTTISLGYIADRGVRKDSKNIDIAGTSFVTGTGLTGAELGGRSIKRVRLQRNPKGIELGVSVRSLVSKECRLSAIEVDVIGHERRGTY